MSRLWIEGSGASGLCVPKLELGNELRSAFTLVPKLQLGNAVHELNSFIVFKANWD